jgi:hypothetical protein
VIQAGIKAYRTLLWLYPDELRIDHGAEMLRLFRDRSRDERRSAGRPGLVRLWLETGLDLLLTVPGAHVEAGRQRYGSPLVLCWIAGCALIVAALLHGVMWAHVRATVWRPSYRAAAGDLPTAFLWSVVGAFAVVAGGLALSTANWRRLGQQARRKGRGMRRKVLLLGLFFFVTGASIEAHSASAKPQKWPEAVLAGTWKGKLAQVADVEITLARKGGKLSGKAAVDFPETGGRDEYQLDGLAFDGAKLTFAMKRDDVRIRNGEIRLVSETEAVLNTDDAAPNEEKNIRLSKQK